MCALSGPVPDVGEVEKKIYTPSGCTTGMAWDGTLLWVADRRTDKLYAVDPQTGEIKNSLETPGYWPTGLAFDDEQLWVADLEKKLAHRIDPKTGVATRTLELEMGKPQGLAWDGEHLWCADERNDMIESLDPEDGTTINSFASPSSNPTGLAHDGSYLWVADRVDDMLYRVDPDTGRVVMKIPSPGKYPYGLACVRGGIWCADYQSDTLCLVCLDGPGRKLISKKRKASMEFVMELSNLGPGMVETSDFYFAVPVNGDNQKLLREIVFDPEPLDFLHDRWGQKVAHFRFEGVEATSKVRAIMRCEVELCDVLYLLDPEKTGTFADIPDAIKENYLVDETKYDIGSGFIMKTADKVAGGEKNVLEAVWKIYDHVISKIEYEMVGGWNTAPTVLERGTGSCSEYTFSFIALCRAAGIPARYAGSVVIRGDDACYDDVFHRWAEVYLPGYGWIPFDPSRGDKKKPADRLKGVGWIANTLLITTRGGGGSEYLGWTYNGEARWTSKGKCTVRTEHIAEWDPLDDEN